MQRTKVINLAEYEAKLQIIICDNGKAAINKLYKKYNIKEKYKHNIAGMMFTVSMNKYYLILDTRYLTYNTICHEVFHLVMGITSDRGVYEEEQRALVQGYLSQIIFDFLKERGLLKTL